jgi:integrase
MSGIGSGGVQNTLRKSFEGALPVVLAQGDGADDGLAGWIEAYFRVEVTTSESSQKVQRRDLERFLAFMLLEEGRDDRVLWTGRLSGAFVQALRRELTTTGRRRYADRTIARITAHLKTFSKWVHKLRPFPLGDPMAKLKTVATGAGLETERALTSGEKRKLLDAADYLPVIGGRSRDRHRHRAELPDERPRRKAYRPWRNRAIVSLLIGTGMRRAAPRSSTSIWRTWTSPRKPPPSARRAARPTATR